MIQKIQDGLKSLTDSELLELLDVVSDEVKRRNSLMGTTAPSLDKHGIQDGIKTIIDAMVKGQGPGTR